MLSFILVVGIGAINFGYSLGVFNSMQKDIIGTFKIATKDTDFWISIITTLCPLGAAIGSLTSGPFTRFGKKTCIHFANILVIIGCSLTLVKILEVVAVGRFILGLAVGTFSVFVPGFINELSPTELKGQLGSSTQILITLGILISNALGVPLPDCVINLEKQELCIKKNPYVAGSFIMDDYWRIVFGMPIVFAVIQSVLLFTVFNYETPKFLKMTGRKAELNEIMGKIYSSDQVQKRIESIQGESGANNSPSYGETVCGPKYMVATIIGCILSLF